MYLLAVIPIGLTSLSFGSKEPITSVQSAVARIGMRAVSNIAILTAVFSTFDRKRGGRFDREEFWRHSICTGIAANVVQEAAENRLTNQYPADVLRDACQSLL